MLGTIPAAIDLPDVLVALAQHTSYVIYFVLDAFSTSKFYTVARHVAISNQGMVVVAAFGQQG